MADFIDVDDLASYTGNSADDATFAAQAALAIAAASQIIRTWTCQTIDQVTDDEVTLIGGGWWLCLPEKPVTAVAVQIDGSPFTGWQLESQVLLSRTDAACWPTLVTVTYTHGYATVPDDIKQVCRALAARLVANPSGMRSEALDDYSYAVADPAGAGALTTAEMGILAPYKVHSPSPRVTLTGPDES